MLDPEINFHFPFSLSLVTGARINIVNMINTMFGSIIVIMYRRHSHCCAILRARNKAHYRRSLTASFAFPWAACRLTAMAGPQASLSNLPDPARAPHQVIPVCGTLGTRPFQSLWQRGWICGLRGWIQGLGAWIHGLWGWFHGPGGWIPGLRGWARYSSGQQTSRRRERESSKCHKGRSRPSHRVFFP
jgi:hypothetical protein